MAGIVPNYWGFLPQFDLIVPKGDTTLSRVMEVIKTVLPLVTLPPMGTATVVGVPLANLLHMGTASILERSLEGRRWALARNSIDLVGLACTVLFSKAQLLFGIPTLCNMWEHRSNLPKTLQQLRTVEGVDYTLNTLGQVLYLGELYSSFGCELPPKNTPTITTLSLTVQGLYQAFLLRGLGLKLLQHEKVINYHTCLLALGITVKATMMVARFIQAWKVWKNEPKYEEIS